MQLPNKEVAYTPLFLHRRSSTDILEKGELGAGWKLISSKVVTILHTY